MEGNKAETTILPVDPKTSTREDNGNVYFRDPSARSKKLPAWLDHFNSRDLKVLFKCSAAAWIYSLFIFIDPTLKTIGNATFFGIIAIFISPPSGIAFIGLMAGITILLGMCIGWAWGVITMKAALATRPAAEVHAKYQQLQQLASANTTHPMQASGQAAFARVKIFEGFMLDNRVTITYFCMSCLLIYFMARLRVRAPKLALVQVFATVICDIFLTIGPLLPAFEGSIGRVLAVPAAIAVGVGLACNFLFFPRSTSRIVLEEMQNTLLPMPEFLEACMITFSSPSQLPNLEILRQTKRDLIASYKSVEKDLGFLSMDMSMGRWSADDVKSLKDPLRDVLTTFIGLLQIHIGRQEFVLKDKDLSELVQLHQGKSIGGSTQAGHHQLLKTFDFRQQHRHADSDRILDDTMVALSSSCQHVLTSCQQALRAVTDAIEASNVRRWVNRPTAKQCSEMSQAHATILEKLRKHKDDFNGRASEHLWDPYEQMFNSSETQQPDAVVNFRRPIGGAILGLVFEERIQNLANALHKLLEVVVAKERSRTKTQLWLPGKLQRLLPWALSKDDTTSPEKTDSSQSPAIDTSHESKLGDKLKKTKKHGSHGSSTPTTAQSYLNATSSHGGRQRNKISTIATGVFQWLSNTEGVFALRMVIVTIALGVLAVTQSTAGFFFREKGLWGLIMAQTGLAPYSADFTFGLIMRTIGTVLGAIIGLVVWYIGAGDGPGNPYGMAAIMALAIVLFMWLRLFTDPGLFQVILLAVATACIVTAYSWVDTHIPSYGNPGVGYSVFWRRTLLVLVGLATASLVTFFPRPPSALRHQCRILSETLASIEARYALFIAACHKDPPFTDLRAVTEDSALAIGEILSTLEPQLKLLRLEFSSSPFNANSLTSISHLCMTLNISLAYLTFYVPELPPTLKSRFLATTGATAEQLVADVNAILALVQHTLRTGDPLPSVLPTPLIIRAAEAAAVTRRRRGEDRKPTGPEKLDRETDAEVWQVSKGFFAEEGARKFSSAMAAYVQFLSSVDEVVLEVKRAVGETGPPTTVVDDDDDEGRDVEA